MLSGAIIIIYQIASNPAGKNALCSSLLLLLLILLPRILFQSRVRTVLLRYGISRSADFIVILKASLARRHARIRTLDHVPIDERIACVMSNRLSRDLSQCNIVLQCEHRTGESIPSLTVLILGDHTTCTHTRARGAHISFHPEDTRMPHTCTCVTLLNTALRCTLLNDLFFLLSLHSANMCIRTHTHMSFPWRTNTFAIVRAEGCTEQWRKPPVNYNYKSY